VADVDALLEALTLEEKALLTAGADAFSLRGVERLGVPKMRVTDGHAGARAPRPVGDDGELPWEVWGILTGRATSVPCGSAVGATWDPGLAEQLGDVVGRDALDGGCRGLLAPTVNLHRALLAGRNFECYSEDPFLSGKLAAGYIRGAQSHGVFATVKHLVGNEAEFERGSISSVIDERALRELYLLPFELAVKEGGALAVMTSYNRVNGLWVTEHAELLNTVLREEWGFEGLVMTDWSGVVNVATSLAAGVDLEMPGPGQALGARVVESIEQGLVDKADLDDAVRRLLTALDKAGALDAPAVPVPATLPSEPQRALLRTAAAEASVLLKNDGVLPLVPEALTRVAVIGEPARQSAMGGGGSSQLIAHRNARPLEALTSALGPGVSVAYERGCDATVAPARVGGPALPAPDGFTTEVFAGGSFDGPPLFKRRLTTLVFAYLGTFSEGYPEGPWSARVRGTVVSEVTGTRRLVLAATATTRVYLDGELVLEGTRPAGGAFDGPFIEDDRIAVDVELTEGVAVELVVEYTHPGGPFGMVRLGVRDVDSELLLERAVEAARAAEVAVVVVGTDDEWETEGYDRQTFSLPGRQDELVRRVAAVNPRTVVVVNAGAPVELPWVDDVAAVLHVWFGGEEMDGALADVLTGRAEPGGRLPVTVPKRLEHSPSYDNFPGENGEVRYGEGLFMGYRGYDHRAIEPLYAFGHGLSYTTFALGEPLLSTAELAAGEELTITVPVTNTGSRSGSEVVQCYVAPRTTRLARPPKELKGFAKVRVVPGETATVQIVLDARSFSYWDDGHADWEQEKARVRSHVEVPATAAGSSRGWRLDPGEYDLLIGTASDRIQHRVTVTIT
jgi:beta-glucosidase